jgi:hypothetical protein
MRVIVALFVGLVLASAQVRATEFRTTQCSKYGQPEIVFEVQTASIPEVDRQWLIRTLEEQVAGGSRFKAGETLQLGWMMNRFDKGEGGTLRLQEPDMKSMPIAFVDRMDNTLVTLRLQKDVAESFTEPVALQFPSLTDSMLVHRNYKWTNHLTLERHAPADADSGWVIIYGTHAPTAEELAADYERVSVYEFAVARRQFIHLLAMPAGTVIEINDGQRDYFLNERPLTPRTGSYLQQLDARLRQQFYRIKVATHVMRFWDIPEKTADGVSCTGNMRVDPTGKITSFEFITCPDDKKLRKSIQAAIDKASPVPLPADPADSMQGMSLVFKTVKD